MASDKRQYETAVEKWTEFQIDGVFSAPVEEGLVAVIASDYPYNTIRTKDDGDFDLEEAMEDDEIDIEGFSEEANLIVERLGLIGVTAELLVEADIDDVTNAIQDKSITDLIFIGHGALAGIFLKGAKNGFFDWKQVSELSTHLKTGSVSQRQCGIQPREFNPALGMFLTSDLTKVRAARGRVFDPKGIGCVENQFIVPVFDTNVPPDYKWLKAHFQNKNKLTL